MPLRKSPQQFKLRPPPRPKSAWGSPVELERKRRINVAAWAYAYEVMNKPIVDDATFDHECGLIDLSINTGSIRHDKFFKTHFDPSTGMWVHKHPNKRRLAEIARLKLAAWKQSTA